MSDPIPLGEDDVGEDDLQRFVDGVLPAERRPTVDRYLEQHPDVARRLAGYAEQTGLLAATLQAKFEEPIPARLRIAAVQGRQQHRLRQRMAQAAAVVLLVGVSGASGWAMRMWTERSEPLMAATRSAFSAYHTFAGETVHPVEVRAEDGDQLAHWLSTRLQRPIPLPDLSALGFRLMGGRLLPAAHAPAAMLMYDDDHGTRLTVDVQPMGIDGREFRLTEQDDMGTVYWAEQNLALAVTGRAPDDRLLAVARSVRDQMDAPRP